jgi:AcrR family transcriptional regulator
VPARAAAAADGRQSRAARSRLAICEACLDLVQEGVLQPSADQVAERAGLSRRSIFNHFADLAELYDAVVEVGMQRCAPLLEPISEREPIASRIEHLVRVRSNFLEGTAAFTRALTAQSLVGPAADQAQRVSRNGLGRQSQEVERLFRPELAGLPAAEQALILEALSAATSPQQWEYLRHGRGHSIARSRAVMQRAFTSILREGLAAGSTP